MANGAAKPLKKGKVRLPPRRGQIKIRIIHKLVNSVMALVSKAGGEGRRRKGGCCASSTSTIPPASAYASKVTPMSDQDEEPGDIFIFKA